jgi:hypothetical protein
VDANEKGEWYLLMRFISYIRFGFLPPTARLPSLHRSQFPIIIIIIVVGLVGSICHRQK